jgi:murein DD-endopeptidase MepM/ murein hydrolase activator NlpD
MALSKNVYSLPFHRKDLIQAISDPRAHFAYFRHAIDFLLPEGSKILAPKSGKVVDLKIDSRTGGIDPKYNKLKYLNYMTIKHSNDEYSQYAHLKHNGSFVKTGDKVRKGQPIALSGNTGFTGAPHLHFQVFKTNKTEIGFETVKVRFSEKIKIDRSQPPVPKEFQKTMDELEKLRKKFS